MAELELKNETLEIPKNTGVSGFLHAIKGILTLPLVQSLNVDKKGKVTYQVYVPKGEADFGPTISFESLMPYACVRNGMVKELTSNEKNPTLTIAKIFQAVSRQRLYPIAWVTGANTTLWDWFRNLAGIEMESEEDFFGLPVLLDRYVDDYVLLLATAPGRTTDMAETHTSFKIIMPQRKENALDSNSGGQGRDLVAGHPGAVPEVGVRGGPGANGALPGKAGGSGTGDRGGASG